MRISLKTFLCILFAVIFFALGLFTLKNYGINWDEPVHYIRGQAFLRYFLTGKKDYRDLPKLKSHYPRVFPFIYPKDISYDDDTVFRRSIYQYEPDTSIYSFADFVNSKGSHPPLNGEFASLFNYVLYQKLGIVGDIDSYHVFILFICTVLIAATFLLVSSRYGVFAGIVSALSLGLYPLFLAESHFNIKDPVSTSFYSLTIFAFFVGITKSYWKWIILSGILAGFSLGTKLNAVFLVPTLFIWLIFFTWSQIRVLKWPFSKSLTISLFLSPFISLFIFFATYPTLWANPIRNFSYVFSYYKGIGYGTVYQSAEFITFFGLNTYSWQWVLYTTPLIILFLFLIGVFFTLLKGLREKNKMSLLVLIWFFIPFIRVSVSNTGIYGGLRQIMEFIPAMAILAGIGASILVSFSQKYIIQKFSLTKRKNKQSFGLRRLALGVQLVVLLFFLPITLKLVSIHPNENVYFNPLIGGLKGAKERNFPDWGTTLGSAYQQGVDWININAEPHAKVALVKGLLPNIPITKFRRDIYFHESFYSGSEKRGEYIMEVIDSHWDTEAPKEKRDYLKTLQPVYEAKVDGVAILAIWKNDGKNLLVH